MFEEELFDGKLLVKLTRDNVAIAEAMIKNDSAYIRSMDVKAASKYNKKNKMVYGGSSAYWMTQLKAVLLDKNEKIDDPYEEIIKYAVDAFDRENSTHINADKCGRKEIADRLCKFDQSELI